MRTLPLIRRDSLMDIRWLRYNELGSCWTRKLRRSNVGRKIKGTIKTGSGATGYCMSLSLEFWRIAEFNSRAHCGISRGERSEKSRNRRTTDSKKEKEKKSGYKNLSSSLANGHDRRHSSSENLLKITLRFSCSRYVHYLVKIFCAIGIHRDFVEFIFMR